jgi:hypothetical protein
MFVLWSGCHSDAHRANFRQPFIPDGEEAEEQSGSHDDFDPDLSEKRPKKQKSKKEKKPPRGWREDDTNQFEYDGVELDGISRVWITEEKIRP